MAEPTSPGDGTPQAVTSFQALHNATDRWKELIRLRELEEIVRRHPEWATTEPQILSLTTIVERSHSTRSTKSKKSK